MPKGRLQIRLSQEALAELERRAGGPDKRQAYIEGWLTSEPVSPNGRKPVSVGVREPERLNAWTTPTPNHAPDCKHRVKA